MTDDEIERMPPPILVKMRKISQGWPLIEDEEVLYLKKQKMEDPKWFLGQLLWYEGKYEEKIAAFAKQDSAKYEEKIALLEAKVAELEAAGPRVQEGEEDAQEEKERRLIHEYMELWDKEREEGLHS